MDEQHSGSDNIRKHLTQPYVKEVTTEEVLTRRCAAKSAGRPRKYTEAQLFWIWAFVQSGMQRRRSSINAFCKLNKLQISGEQTLTKASLRRRYYEAEELLIREDGDAKKLQKLGSRQIRSGAETLRHHWLIKLSVYENARLIFT